MLMMSNSEDRSNSNTLPQNQTQQTAYSCSTNLASSTRAAARDLRTGSGRLAPAKHGSGKPYWPKRGGACEQKRGEKDKCFDFWLYVVASCWHVRTHSATRPHGHKATQPHHSEPWRVSGRPHLASPEACSPSLSPALGDRQDGRDGRLVSLSGSSA